MVYNTKVREFDKRVMFGGKSVPYKEECRFSKIYKSGKSVANRQFVVYTYDNKEQEHFRLGISVSKIR